MPLLNKVTYGLGKVQKNFKWSLKAMLPCDD